MYEHLARFANRLFFQVAAPQKRHPRRTLQLESVEPRVLLAANILADAPNIDFEITNSWNSGHQAELVVINDESTSYADWQLEFDYDGSINNLWNAQVENLGGGRYRITAPSWDAKLDAGQSLAIGFVATGAGSTPTNFSFLANGVTSPPTDGGGGNDGGGVIGTGSIHIEGADANGEALQITIDQGTSEFDLSVVDSQAASFTVATNNAAVIAAEIVGDGVLRITGLTAGRASLKLTDALSGEVRYVGIRVRTAEGELPGLPDYVSIGSVSEDTVGDLAFWQDYDSGDPLTNKYVDSRYIYLPGGPFNGWRNWGDRVGSYIRESMKLGMVPQFVYYNIPDSGESYEIDTQHINSTTYMEAYFQDLKFALDTIHSVAGNELVQMILEPDFLGYLMQNAGAPASELSAVTNAIYSSGVLTRGVDPDFDDSVTGLIHAINYTIGKYAPNVEFGWQFNLWASPGIENPIPFNGIVHLTDTLGMEAGRAAIAREAELIAEYYIDAGVLSYGADFISLDKYGLDAGAEAGAAANPASSTWFWNSDHWHNYLLVVKTLTTVTEKEMVLWQIPVGHINNSQAASPYDSDGQFDSLDNTFQHYEDSAPSFFFGDSFTASGNRLAYFSTNDFGDSGLTIASNTITWGSHIEAARAAGVRQILFGAGVGASTDSIGSEPTDDYWWITKVQQYYQDPVLLQDDGEVDPPNEEPPTVGVSGATVQEGNSGFALATFTISLSEPSNAAVTVNYQTTSGTATAGEDFEAASGQITFAAGEVTQTLTVRIWGDLLIEPDEEFTVTLSEPTGALLEEDHSQAAGAITNDDTATTTDIAVSTPFETAIEIPLGDGALQSLTQPAHGEVIDNQDGTLTYLPADRFAGDDSFVFETITDSGIVVTAVSVVVQPAVTEDPPSAGDANLTVVNDWTNGFQGQIEIRNEGSTAWDGWTLEFTFAGEITNIWNAVIVSHIGDTYVIQGASWNSRIGAGGRTSFGFIANPGGEDEPFDDLKVTGDLV
ncbi:cellulose binding domain-containing protein [Blastopirellula retiformator]|uniref:Exoglucanase/xylanase n=1 Tax=Blastopirellula retiformator TaxID=2527970 RepID=A0A5C5UUQ7_9BACT|nr:cellulose binding domain-containing protein [Blastopirellula retiformator]TWT29280.1 Exoglucanase/xylanase precursor [Blastopirellula retiformator]